MTSQTTYKPAVGDRLVHSDQYGPRWKCTITTINNEIEKAWVTYDADVSDEELTYTKVAAARKRAKPSTDAPAEKRKQFTRDRPTATIPIKETKKRRQWSRETQTLPNEQAVSEILQGRDKFRKKLRDEVDIYMKSMFDNARLQVVNRLSRTIANELWSQPVTHKYFKRNGFHPEKVVKGSASRWRRMRLCREAESGDGDTGVDEDSDTDSSADEVTC